MMAGAPQTAPIAPSPGLPLDGSLDRPTVHAILLNWNRAEDTLACVASLLAADYAPLQVLVVDQASQDRSPARIRARFPMVDVLELAQNVGFAAGMNHGIVHALGQGATHLLLLNNDTWVDPGMIRALLAALTPGVGMVGPVIFYADHPDQVWSMGGGMHPVLLEMTGRHGRGAPLPSQPVARGFLSGCCLLLPATTVAQVGLWDERFFMYYEDLDYCLRVTQAGLRLLLAPDARMWHKVSASSGGARSPQERFATARSSGYYFRKHMRGARIPAIVLFRLGSALMWTGRLARERQWAALAAYWRGLAAGWLLPPTTRQATGR